MTEGLELSDWDTARHVHSEMQRRSWLPH